MEEKTDLDILKDWFSNRLNRLQRKMNLVQSGQKPVIHDFYTDELFTAEHGKVNLYWEVSNFHALKINQNVGDVTGKSHMIVRLAPQVTSFTLTAYGGFGKTSKTIHIEPVSFHDHKMPMAIVSNPQISMKLPKLVGKRSESQGKGRNFQQVSEQGIPQLDIRMPIKPQQAELEKLQIELKEAFKVKEVATLQAHLERLKRVDLLEKLNDIDYNDTESFPS